MCNVFQSRSVVSATFAILCVTCAPDLAAQDYSMSPVQFPSAFNVAAMENIGQIADDVEARIKQPSRSIEREFSANPNRQTGGGVSDEGMLRYKVDLKRRKQNLEMFVQQSRIKAPDTANGLDQIFKSTDIIGGIGRAIAPFGLSESNIADAYTVWWVNAWQASRGHNNPIDRGTAQAVKAQVASVMLQSGMFSGTSAAQKQEMAEALLIQAALIDAAVEESKSNGQQLKELQKVVRQGARATGVDLDAVTLTEEGFVPAKGRKGSSLEDDLAPAPGGEGDTALAAADTNTPAATGEPANPPYILMAAAGGAGIAGVFMLGKLFGKRG